MRPGIFIFSAVFVFLLCSYSFAFAPNETPAGTDIYSDKYTNTLIYTDPVGTLKPTAYSFTIETFVASIFGFDAVANLPDWNYTTPGVPITYVYYVTSESNTSNYYDANGRLGYNVGGVAGFNGAGWSIKCSTEVNAGFTQNLSNVPPPNVMFGIDPDPYAYAGQTRRLYVTVYPSSLESQSPDGSYVAATTEVWQAGGLSPYGIYLGANGYSYGGYDGQYDTPGDLTFTCIHTSVMQMSRTATIDAPIIYTSNANAQLGGNHSHDGVPGAVITFVITYSNTSSAVAKNILVMDKVPASTEAAHVNAYYTSQAGLPNVTITASAPNAPATWAAYYSTSATPGQGYGNLTGWVTINANLAPSSFATGSGIKYIKWEKSLVPTGEANKTLNWGVTIR